MSALTPDQQELFNVAKSTVPRQLFPDKATQELFGAAAKVFAAAKTQIKAWFDSSYILGAFTFWLDQHARDRGTRRRNTETDPALQSRLRGVEDMVTPDALAAVANGVLTADAIAGVAHIVELRNQRIFFHPHGVADPPGRHYLSRGERITRNFTHRFIVVLPFGTTTPTSNAVDAGMVTHKGAGQAHTIEIRATP